MSRRKQRWFIQVDEYPPKGEWMYGPRTDGRAKKVTYRVEAEDGVEYVDD